MKTWLLVFAALGVAGCGTRSQIDIRALTGSASAGTSATGGQGVGGASTGGDATGGQGTGIFDAGPDARPPAPTPVCTGEDSACVVINGVPQGAAVITCAGVDFVGPWALVLQRRINNQWVTVAMQQVQEPGFGATFDDTSGPPAQLTYQVCVSDKYGFRCGTPFTTYGPVDCACRPFTCEDQQACMTEVDDGCGGTLVCGECTGGALCDVGSRSCCPVGMQPDDLGGCVCAPPVPCHQVWDPQICQCVYYGP